MSFYAEELVARKQALDLSLVVMAQPIVSPTSRTEILSCPAASMGCASFTEKRADLCTQVLCFEGLTSMYLRVPQYLHTCTSLRPALSFRVVSSGCFAAAAMATDAVTNNMANPPVEHEQLRGGGTAVSAGRLRPQARRQ